ncbi:hypothetical protein BH20ACT1_BH20ACT1_04830 [soil metagenome]
MTIVLDAGALLAVERGDREVIARIKHERQEDRAPLSHGGVIGQVWRGGGDAKPTSLVCYPASTSVRSMTTWADEPGSSWVAPGAPT